MNQKTYEHVEGKYLPENTTFLSSTSELLPSLISPCSWSPFECIMLESICGREDRVADTHIDDTNFFLNILLCNTLLHGGKVLVSRFLIFVRDLFKFLALNSKKCFVY